MSDPHILIHPVLTQYKREVWSLFAPHHYLTATLNVGGRCYVATWGDDLVAFTSAITMPSGTLQRAWREHRTVVLPDYQGLGIGAILTDWLGETICADGNRFYSRTSHPRLAEYRRSRPNLWRETAKSGQFRKEWWSGARPGQKKSADGTNQTWITDTTRPAFSFEYIGHGTPAVPN
jgi:GNAT superfamily N-acetyltransferase